MAAAGLFGAALLSGGSGSSPAGMLISAGRPAHAAPASFKADCSAQPEALQQDLSRISRSFNGKVGIAVAKAGCGWVVGDRLDEYFPQQSVSKLWVSLTVLDAVDSGRIRLTDPLTIRPNDLTLFNQPLRWEVLEKGQVVRPVQTLMGNALSLSDNTANDRLLWTVGGPDQVRAMLKTKEIEGIRFGPGERLLQSGISGLQWQQDFSLGSNFEQARAKLPIEQREASLERYVADPIDGARPAGMARALARLAAGQLLSPESTGVMMGILAKTHSGPRRLKAGAPAGWKVYHKTGTGQELRGVATGYNDVAIMETPDGAWYSVVVMVGRTTEPIPARMEMMHEVVGALGRFHAAASR
jgi:beta-lactamase class A